MSLYLPFLPIRDLTRETAKQGKESHRVNTKQSRQYAPSLTLLGPTYLSISKDRGGHNNA